MRLVGPLVNGFSDAPNGSATIYRRGTTTPATVYSDFKGQNIATTHTFDSKGRVVRYVNEIVDVSVFDSSGNQLATFTAGENATSTEIIHAHVTGADYDTGAAGLNKPSTLQLQLDARYSSFGADDFKVLVGGAQKNLKDVLLTGLIDVKGPTYGAKGDGVTDDTVSIQNALNAANAAGGGIVLFPAGTYIVSTLTIPSNVTFIGAGSQKSILSTTSATETLLVGSGAFSAQGMKFKTTGKGLLRYTAGVNNNTVFTACAFDPGIAGTGNVSIAADVGGSLNLITFIGCDFTRSTGGTAQAILGVGCRLYGGTVTFGTAPAFYDGTYSSATGVYFEYQGAVAGNLTTSPGATGGVFTAVGCAFIPSGAGAFNLNGGQYLSEVGCDMGLATVTAAMRFSDNRQFNQTSAVATAATSYQPTPTSLRKIFVHSSGATFQWTNPANFGVDLPNEMFLFYKNTSGGNVTPTFDTAYKGSAVLVASGSGCGWLFVYNSTLGKWVQIGSPVAYAA